MAAYCTLCKKTVDSDERCPTCLRQSTLVAADQVPKSPNWRKIGAAFGLLTLAILLPFDIELTSWLRLSDMGVSLVSIGVVSLAWRLGFFAEEAKASANRVALFFGGTIFGAISLGAFVLALFAFSDPWALSRGSDRLAATHHWALGILALAAQIIFGQLARMLWKRLLRGRKNEPVKAKLLPLATNEPRRAAPRGYRDGGKAVALRLEDLSLSLETAMPGADLKVRGARLLLKSADRKSKYLLDVGIKTVGYPETGSADDVKLGSMCVEASDELIVVQVSHALASSLGPHLLAFVEESLIIDGARSPEQLIGEYLTRGNDKLLAGMREIDRLEARAGRKI